MFNIILANFPIILPIATGGSCNSPWHSFSSPTKAVIMIVLSLCVIAALVLLYSMYKDEDEKTGKLVAGCIFSAILILSLYGFVCGIVYW